MPGGDDRFRAVRQVTSMDMTPDGSYVVTGCSDGSIRLYSTASEVRACLDRERASTRHGADPDTAWRQSHWPCLLAYQEDWGVEGLLLGQILAKGLITSLIFHVEVRGAVLIPHLTSSLLRTALTLALSLWLVDRSPRTAGLRLLVSYVVRTRCMPTTSAACRAAGSSSEGSARRRRV